MKIEHYLVVWRDATCNSGWFDEHSKEDFSTATVCTIGFLVELTKDHVTLAQGLAADGGFLNYNTIPTKWVLWKKKCTTTIPKIITEEMKRTDAATASQNKSLFIRTLKTT